MTELPLELKKAVVKAHNAYEKDWKYHLKVCEHDCKDTEKQKDLFGVGYSAGQTRTEGVFASFLESKRKELKDIFCQRKSLGYPCGKVSKDCEHCGKIDAVLQGGVA